MILTMSVTTLSVCAAPTDPTITVESVTSQAGETVSIKVSISNNPGIWGMDLSVSYDKSNLTLTNVANGTVFSSSEWTQGDLAGDKYILSYEASGFNDISTNGVLATLTFKISDTANSGDYSVTASYNTGDIINVSFDDISFVVVNGKITVSSIGCAHNNTTDVLAEPSTCQKQGNNAYTVCDDCGTVISGSDAKLPLADCDWVEVVDSKYLKSSATCVKKAVYYKSCSVCEQKGTTTFESGEVDSTKHNLVKVPAKPETHEKDGNILYYDCVDCDKYFTDENGTQEILLKDTVIAKGEHDYATTYKTNATHHWKECDCGSVKDKATHDFGEWAVTQEATQNKAGSKERICTVCQYKQTQRISALSGAIDIVITQKPNTSTGGSDNSYIVFVAVSILIVSVLGTVFAIKRKRVK